MHQPWAEKYQPQSIEEIIGNKSVIQTILKWVDQWPRSISRNRRALLLHGPPGVGKTIAVYIIAKQLGFEINEINASDKRSKKVMQQLLNRAANAGSLFSKRGRILLIDELAGLSGKSDRGASSAFKEFIPKTRVPMIFVTTDITANLFLVTNSVQKGNNF